MFVGDEFGAGLMLAAAFVRGRFGVDAERKSLEDVAAPVSSEPLSVES